MKFFVALLALLAFTNGKLFKALGNGRLSYLLMFFITHVAQNENCEKCKGGVIILGGYLTKDSEIEKTKQILKDLVCSDLAAPNDEYCDAGNH